MGKLGLKARKFARKNLPSVYRRQRKNKALFKKRFSAKKERNTAKNLVAKKEQPNESTTHDEAFEDVSLGAAFMEDKNDMVEVASDSDGYLSEETGCEPETEPISFQEDSNDGSSLSEENQILFEDLAAKKRKLERIKKKNPNFCKFLEEQEVAGVHRGALDSDEDEIDEDESGSGERKKHSIKDTDIASWRELIKEEHRESTVASLLNAYRMACHYGAEPGHRFQSSNAFCDVILFVLSEADNLIRELLKISSSKSKKEVIKELCNISKSKNARPLKSYLRSTLFFLNEATDSDVLAFVLTRLRASAVFFAAIPTLLPRLIKTSVHLWATGGGQLSSASFLLIRETAALFTSECFVDILDKTFSAYLAQSSVSEIVNIKHIQFLRDSLVDLFSIDIERCSKKAIISITHLGKVLKWALHTKKREAVKKICSWEYINCVDLWVEFLSANMQDYDLQPLFFTMVQLINGIACMFSGPRYFPLRLKCIKWLNRLSSASGIFVPVASFVLDILEYKMVKEDGKHGSDLNFDSVLKLPKHCLKSKVFQEESVLSVIEQLAAHFAQWSFHISFPELATIPIIRLNKFHELTSNESLKRMIKRLIDQVEQNADFVQRKRDEVAFSPNDHQSVELFLQLEKTNSNAPFTQYYKSVLDKAALRSLKNDSKTSLPMPEKKPIKAEKKVDEADMASADQEKLNSETDDGMVKLKGKKKKKKKKQRTE